MASNGDNDRKYSVAIEEIRRFQKDEPFHPFEIVMVDGRVFKIPHPDFILVPPRGTWVYVTDKYGNTAHLNLLVINLVRKSARNGKRRRAG